MTSLPVRSIVLLLALTDVCFAGPLTPDLKVGPAATGMPLVGATLRSGVSGRVIDPSGRPVEGATVIISGEGIPLRSVLTDGAGAFNLDVPETTRLEVRVAVPGFRTELVTLAPTSSRELGTMRLSLSAMSESVVVSAAQVEIPLSSAASTVTVITATDLRARQVHSLADALRTVPGITVAATGGYGAVTGVFPRGGESNFTLVFVDDVPVNAFGGEYDFAHLTTENVERIEIVRGPQSALFGSNAIGSVVRVVTRRGGAPTISGSVEAGGYGTNRLAAGSSGSLGAFEWGASGERLTSDGFNGETVNGFTVHNDDYSRRSAALTAGWRTGPTTIRGQLSHAVDHRGVPGPFGTNPIGAFESIDTISRGDNAQTLASITATAPLSGRVRSTFQGSYHRLESDFLSPFGKSESHSRRWSGRALIDFPVVAGLDLSAGAELQREDAGSTFITGATFQPVPVERTNAGYFAEARWTATQRLQITGGLRLDDIRRSVLEASPDPFTPRPAMDDDSVLSLNPKAALAWTVRGSGADHTKVRGAVGTGIRPPGAFDLAFTDNPSLKPERSFSSELGVEQAIADGKARAEAVAFFNTYDDLIVAVGSFRESSRYRTDNISNARARGFELALAGAHRVAAFRDLDVHARVAYTWLDSEVLAVDNDDTAPPPFSVGEPLLRRPRHQVSAELTGTTGRLTMFVAGGARSRVLDVEPSFGTFGGLHYADGFQAWNAGASWRVWRIGEIFGRVENLFDSGYEEALGFPALGRRATMGIRIAPGR